MSAVRFAPRVSARRCAAHFRVSAVAITAAALMACASDRAHDVPATPSSALPPRDVAAIVATDAGADARSAARVALAQDGATAENLDAASRVVCEGAAFEAYERRVSDAVAALDNARASKKNDRVAAATQSAVAALQSTERRAWRAASPAAEKWFAGDADHALAQFQSGMVDEATRTLQRHFALLHACEFGMMGLIEQSP